MVATLQWYTLLLIGVPMRFSVLLTRLFWWNGLVEINCQSGEEAEQGGWPEQLCPAGGHWTSECTHEHWGFAKVGHNMSWCRRWQPRVSEIKLWLNNQQGHYHQFPHLLPLNPQSSHWLEHAGTPSTHSSLPSTGLMPTWVRYVFIFHRNDLILDQFLL